MRFIILRMEGPLMYFGKVAVDEHRPTDELPSASQLTGLIANALGWRFGQTDGLLELQGRVLFGSRIERSGHLLVDYQNAQLANNDLLWRRGQEAAIKRGGGNLDSGPVQRWRHYIAGGRVTVVLTLEPAESAPDLSTVAQALERPFRPLFLGRVNCPPASPLFRGEWVDAPDVRQALIKAPLWPPQPGDPPAKREPSAPFKAEWPDLGDWPPGWGGADWQRILRPDLRDWPNNIHAGGRMVIRGLVEPEASKEQAK